jgi:hypothetical protein
MQPMFTAVSLRWRVMLKDGRMRQRLRKHRPGTTTAHDGLQACNPGHIALVVLCRRECEGGGALPASVTRLTISMPSSVMQPMLAMLPGRA